jgi:hypothetical protein
MSLSFPVQLLHQTMSEFLHITNKQLIQLGRPLSKPLNDQQVIEEAEWRYLVYNKVPEMEYEDISELFLSITDFAKFFELRNVWKLFDRLVGRTTKTLLLFLQHLIIQIDRLMKDPVCNGSSNPFAISIVAERLQSIEYLSSDTSSSSSVDANDASANNNNNNNGLKRMSGMITTSIVFKSNLLINFKNFLSFVNSEILKISKENVRFDGCFPTYSASTQTVNGEIMKISPTQTTTTTTTTNNDTDNNTNSTNAFLNTSTSNNNNFNYNNNPNDTQSLFNSELIIESFLNHHEHDHSMVDNNVNDSDEDEEEYIYEDAEVDINGIDDYGADGDGSDEDGEGEVDEDGEGEGDGDLYISTQTILSADDDDDDYESPNIEDQVDEDDGAYDEMLYVQDNYIYDNPICEQTKYRWFLIYHLTSLVELDGVTITQKEREESLRIIRCYFDLPSPSDSMFQLKIFVYF